MQPVYVVKNMKNNLLGYPAIKVLNLLSHVESVDKKLFCSIPCYSVIWAHLHMITKFN